MALSIALGILNLSTIYHKSDVTIKVVFCMQKWVTTVITMYNVVSPYKCLDTEFV